MIADRPADLTTTRDLLCAMLHKSERVLLSAGNVQGAIGSDSKPLRYFRDQGQLSFGAKRAQV